MIGRETKLMRFFCVTLVISLILVWGQSCLSKNESQSYSNVFVDMITPIDQLDIDENHSNADWWEFVRIETYVRKSAHIIEYAAVGFQLMCLGFLYRSKRKVSIEEINNKKNKKQYVRLTIDCLSIGCFVGLVDETIQIFSNRGSLVSDVWIDSIGIVIGIVMAYLARNIYMKKVAKHIKCS